MHRPFVRRPPPASVGGVKGIIGTVILLTTVSAGATELRLRFRDEEGRAVRPKSAELLMKAWGDAVRLNLETGVMETPTRYGRIFLWECPGGMRLAAGEPLVLPLDAEWLAARWPERFRDIAGAYLYFTADGYASVCSGEFRWIGSQGPPYGTRMYEAVITFPGRESIIVKEGQSVEADLVFRRPRPRSLRLIDDQGNPVQDVKVSIFMFWSAYNHCGTLGGADPIGSAKSSHDGRVSVPDGDFEYAFEFEKRLYVLNEPDAEPYIPPRLFAHLSKPETTVKMHRWERRPLEIIVTAGGEPAQGLIVGGCLAACPCGACCGQLAHRDPDKRTRMDTDENGHFQMPDFYPEEFERVYLIGGENKEIWSEDPKKWPSTGIIRVELKK